MAELVLVKRDAPIAVVLLNRPQQLNALSDGLMDEVTDLVFNGFRNGFDLTQLVSHRFPLEQAVEAIDVASHPKSDSMKIMIEPVVGSGAE